MSKEELEIIYRTAVQQWKAEREQAARDAQAAVEKCA